MPKSNPDCEQNRAIIRASADWLSRIENILERTDDGREEQDEEINRTYENLARASTSTKPDNCELEYTEFMSVECSRCMFYINLANL